MNCEYVDQLLPLYIGSDLEEERSVLVAAHLRSCTRCARSAEEYAGASRLLQEFEPPLFSEAIYAGIRRQVLNEIEQTSQAPAWSSTLWQFFAPLVQPRAIAIAAAVLLATLIAASYFVIQRSQSSREQVADGNRALEQGAANPNTGTRAEKNQPESSSLTSDRSSEHSSSGPGTVRRKRVVTGGVSSVVAVAQPTKSRPRTPGTRAEDSRDMSQMSPAPATLRVEMQTNDPNIRIIWFSSLSQDGPKDSSKGI